MVFGVVGDVILDITVQAHGPLQLGSDVVGKISYQGGGSAANLATWLGSLGSEVRFAGALGQDLAGQISRLELERYRVETFLAEKTEPTGTILLFLDEEGERTMVTSRGANLLLRTPDLPPEFFQGLSHLHLTAYSLFGSEELARTALEILDQARQMGFPISVDPSSYALLEEFGVERFLTATKGVSLLFPNLEEGRMLSGEGTPEAIVKVLLRHYPVVVLTLGLEGCLCGQGEELFYVPTPQVPVVDTTGAGDAFAAGFLHEFYQSSSLIAAAHAGNALASSCVQHYGGRPPWKAGTLDR